MILGAIVWGLAGLAFWTILDMANRRGQAKRAPRRPYVEDDGLPTTWED